MGRIQIEPRANEQQGSRQGLRRIACHLRQCCGQAAARGIATHDKRLMADLIPVSGVIIIGPRCNMRGGIFGRERIERRGYRPAILRGHVRQKFPVDGGCRIHISAAMPEQDMRAWRAALRRYMPDSSALKHALPHVETGLYNWGGLRSRTDLGNVFLKLRATCKHPAIMACGAQHKSSEAGGKTWHKYTPLNRALYQRVEPIKREAGDLL